MNLRQWENLQVVKLLTGNLPEVHRVGNELNPQASVRGQVSFSSSICLFIYTKFSVDIPDQWL